MQLRIGVLTVSDRVAAGKMEDSGGAAVEAGLADGEWRVAERAVVPDDSEAIVGQLRRWCDEAQLDIIFTTGGTGLGPRDVTPEATLQVAPRLVPGIAEAMRAAGREQTEMAMISRAVAAARGTTLIINLPGNPRGAADGVAVARPVLEHAVAILHGGRH